MKRSLLVCVVIHAMVSLADAQFLETFDDPELRVDPRGVEGWSFFSGDGEATIDFRGSEKGYASILVDATLDRRNIWWALIKHRVSEQMDLEQLSRPGWELRVEARIRSSHAPRRVNLHLNTQRTTDFHSHLMEFDLPEAERWYTISMTTHSVQRNADETKDFGLVRVVEILAGDPAWRRETVTAASILQGEALDEVFNPQMIIDWPVNETPGGKTWFTISRPVLQRLIDGRTLGLAVTPLGSINASFSNSGKSAPRLLFDIEE